MGKTIPGGFYIGSNGRAHDAHGNDLGRPITGDFPAGEKLLEAGYRTDKDVQQASDEELRAIDGIGKKTLEEIRERAPRPEED